MRGDDPVGPVHVPGRSGCRPLTDSASLCRTLNTNLFRYRVGNIESGPREAPLPRPRSQGPGESGSEESPPERSHPDNFRSFLVGLATDPARLGNFVRDAEASMTEAGLSEGDRAILRSADPAAIHGRLTGVQAAGPAQPVTLLVVTVGEGEPGAEVLHVSPVQVPSVQFPQIQPQQILPQVHPVVVQQIFPQQIFPQQVIHPQQIFPQQIFPQQIFPQVIHPQQIFPQQIFPQVIHPQQIFPQQIFPQIDPRPQ
jgi:hypothetical protein